MLKHQPETPCRQSVYGEEIYLGHWQRFLATTPKFGDGLPDERFDEVFASRVCIDVFSSEKEDRKIAQRAATVAASFIVWLGTNCGRSLVDAAKKRASATKERGEVPLAFLVEWTIHNRRCAWRSGGKRAADVIVNTPDAFDLEVMESTAEWLGSADGLKLVKEAEQEIEVTQMSLREQNQMIGRAQARAADLRGAGIVAF